MIAETTKRRKAYRWGWLAEGIAIWYLRCKGYRIIARRYKTKVGEIDLVVARGAIIVGVEVKARKNTRAGLESVVVQQQQRITRAMEHFIQKHPRYSDYDIRFDVVVVTPLCMPHHVVAAWGM